MSVIGPAAACGIVGVKLSHDRVPFEGVSLAPSIDSVGLLTRTVEEVEQVAGLLVPDWRRAGSVESLAVLAPNPGPFLARAAAEVLDAFEEQLRALAADGIRIVRNDGPWDDVNWQLRAPLALLQLEMATVHRAWFDRYADLYRPNTAESVSRSLKMNPARLPAFRDARIELRNLVHGALERAGADILVCPSAVCSPQPLATATRDASMSAIWSAAGLPAASVPAGVARDGMPFGLQLVGRFNRDEEVVSGAARVAVALGCGSKRRPT